MPVKYKKHVPEELKKEILHKYTVEHVSVNRLRDEYQISFKTIRNFLVEKRVFNPLVKRTSFSPTRFIRKRGNHYHIAKLFYFGTYRDLDEAMLERDRLEKCNWDFDLWVEGFGDE